MSRCLTYLTPTNTTGKPDTRLPNYFTEVNSLLVDTGRWTLCPTLSSITVTAICKIAPPLKKILNDTGSAIIFKSPASGVTPSAQKRILCLTKKGNSIWSLVTIVTLNYFFTATASSGFQITSRKPEIQLLPQEIENFESIS